MLFQPAVDGAHFDVGHAHIREVLHDAVGVPVHSARDDEDAPFPEFGAFCRYGVHISEPERVEFDGGEDDGVAGEEIVFAELDVVVQAARRSPMRYSGGRTAHSRARRSQVQGRSLTRSM